MKNEALNLVDSHIESLKNKGHDKRNIVFTLDVNTVKSIGTDSPISLNSEQELLKTKYIRGCHLTVIDTPEFIFNVGVVK